MHLKSVNETEIEPIYCSSDTDIKENYITEKYFILVKGYSLLSNIGFIKIDIGFGTSQNDAIIRSFDKIGLDLFVNYNISINHMWTKECRLYDSRDTIQSSKFAFFTLTDELIQQYREDGESYCMYREDK
jgi:hypothetical protein